MAVKVKRKTRTFANRMVDAVSWFLGSWVGVIFHTLWFAIWLVFHFDINILTFSVSLEAIFIGIFLLMSSNKAEIKRDRREARQRKEDRKRLEHDIRLDQKADRQLTEIKRLHKGLHRETKLIKKRLIRLEKKLG
jgi:uncharacterized membrane protein